jgi:Txe/YoeB family toxin of Txe-Axe toxin-antitoxin module
MYRLTYGFELTRFGTHQKVEPLKPKNRRGHIIRRKKDQDRFVYAVKTTVKAKNTRKDAFWLET